MNSLHSSCENSEDKEFGSSAQNVVISAQNVDIGVPSSAQNVDVGAQNVDVGAQNVDIGLSHECTRRYKCGKCCKPYARLSQMKKHEDVCIGYYNPLKCPKCEQEYADRSSKSRHMKICDGFPKRATQQLTVHTQKEQPIVEAATPAINNSIVQSSINSNNVNHIQQLNIIINSFGKEKDDHITDEFKDARLKEFNGRGILNYIKSVHFNPDMPENHNIRKRDNKYCQVLDEGEGWIIRSLSSMMTDLVHLYKQKLEERLVNPGFKLSLDCETTWYQIRDNLVKFDRNRNPADYYRTIRDVAALLENLETGYTKAS
jgi:hypothetical protein